MTRLFRLSNPSPTPGCFLVLLALAAPLLALTGRGWPV